jgi:hypothetical protein
VIVVIQFVNAGFGEVGEGERLEWEREGRKIKEAKGKAERGEGKKKRGKDIRDGGERRKGKRLIRKGEG